MAQNEKSVVKDTSMTSLVCWNINKVLDTDPHLDLVDALKRIQEHICNGSRSMKDVTTMNTLERYLTCAMLAWQRLGHQNADSLHKFYVEKLKEREANETRLRILREERISKQLSFIGYKDVGMKTGSSFTIAGPVIKLPMDTKIIMRVDPSKPSKVPTTRNCQVTVDRLEAICCNKPKCGDRLTALDSMTLDLKCRAEKLAKREAHRVELLERAENAWSDLERGYQRRIALAVEKENTIERQLKSLIQERDGYKASCKSLVETLKKLGDCAEKDQKMLSELEEKTCKVAVTRLAASKEAVAEDMAAVREQNRLTQHEAHLQLKEEQERRKLECVQNNLEAAELFKYESEGLVRAELRVLKEKINGIQQQIDDVQNKSEKVKKVIAGQDEEKKKLTEGFEGCRRICDQKMQDAFDDYKKKRSQLQVLKEKIIECKCKLPMDIAVTVKRTPSLAAACGCKTQADARMDTCSCTSVRTRLLLNLFADLFGGLTQMLAETGCQMPCQMLKCFDDKFNWEKASTLKSNLNKYFEDLLSGEIEIAITNSIENYHAQWVGASCADKYSKTHKCCSLAGSEKKHSEDRAKSLATKLGQQLAMQLFNDNTPNTGSPSCDCSRLRSNKGLGGHNPLAFHIQIENDVMPLVRTQKVTEIMSRNSNSENTTEKSNYLDCQKNNSPIERGTTVTNLKNIYKSKICKVSRGTTTKTSAAATVLKKTREDVLLLRAEISDLKKNFINKEDLKVTEKKNLKSVQLKSKDDEYKRSAILEYVPTNDILSCQKRNLKKKSESVALKPMKMSKKITFKRKEHTFTVNLCLLEPSKVSKNSLEYGKASEMNGFKYNNSSLKSLSKTSNFKHTKPVRTSFCFKNSKLTNYSSMNVCDSKKACFHKKPSTSSIDQLLNTLKDWNCNLVINSSKISQSKGNSNMNNNSFVDKHRNIDNSLENKVKQTEQENIYLQLNEDYKKECNEDQQCSLITQSLITGIHSEYIGAVNLDKSNDKLYKRECVTSNDAYKIKNSTYPINCANVHLYNSNSQQILNDNLRKPCTTSKETTTSNDKIFTKKQASDQMFDPCLSKKDQTNQKMNLFSTPECDYNIQLLGVTLDNMNFCQKLREGTINKNKHSSGCLMPGSKSDCANERSQNIINCKTESCICCSYDKNLTHSNDLEINTYDLLESHLKKKILHFRNQSVNKILSPSEEKDIYDVIIKKVKGIITESFANVPCTCDDSQKNSKSWSRVHYLLQEYLKSKVSRIQCQCPPNNECREKVVPNLLTKIRELIDNDFDKLNILCRENNPFDGVLTNQKDYTLINYVPEIKLNADVLEKKKSLNFTRNVSSQVQPSLRTTVTSCNAILPSPLVSKSTDAEQVLVTNATTSCSAVKVTPRNVCDCYTTLHKQIRRFGNSEILISCSHELHCNPVFPYISKFHAIRINENPNTQSADVTDTTNIPVSVESFCEEKLNSDACSKSCVDNNNVLNQDILNQFIQDKLNEKTASYIMKNPEINSVSLSSGDLEKDDHNDLDKSQTKIEKTETCSKVVVTDEDEEYVLKQCNNVQNEINHKTTNSDECSPLVKFSEVKKYKLTNKKPYRNPCNKSSLEQYSSEENMPRVTDSGSLYCNCDLVPLCHVKMLVEDVEKKLLQSNITYD